MELAFLQKMHPIITYLMNIVYENILSVTISAIVPRKGPSNENAYEVNGKLIFFEVICSSTLFRITT